MDSVISSRDSETLLPLPNLFLKRDQWTRTALGKPSSSKVARRTEARDDGLATAGVGRPFGGARFFVLPMGNRDAIEELS